MTMETCWQDLCLTQKLAVNPLPSFTSAKPRPSIIPRTCRQKEGRVVLKMVTRFVVKLVVDAAFANVIPQKD